MIQRIVINDPFREKDPIVLNYEEWEYKGQQGRGYVSNDQDEIFVPAIFDQQLPDIDELMIVVDDVTSNMNEVELFEE